MKYFNSLVTTYRQAEQINKTKTKTLPNETVIWLHFIKMKPQFEMLDVSTQMDINQKR